MRKYGDAVNPHAVEVTHRAHHRLGVRGVHAGDRHVTNDLMRLDAHEVDGAEHRLRIRDRPGDARERAALLGHVQPHGEAVGRRGLDPRRHSVSHALHRIAPVLRGTRRRRPAPAAARLARAKRTRGLEGMRKRVHTIVKAR